MNDREMRELLQEIIDDVDSGRVEIERPRTLRRAGTVLAAAAALGLAACGPTAPKNVQAPQDGRPQAAQVDGSAPKRPTPPKPRVDPGPQPEYAAPITTPDKRPKPRKKPRIDPGPQAEYAAPAVPKARKPKRPPKRIGGGENKPLYGVP